MWHTTTLLVASLGAGLPADSGSPLHGELRRILTSSGKDFVLGPEFGVNNRMSLGRVRWRTALDVLQELFPQIRIVESTNKDTIAVVDGSLIVTASERAAAVDVVRLQTRSIAIDGEIVTAIEGLSGASAVRVSSNEVVLAGQFAQLTTATEIVRSLDRGVDGPPLLNYCVDPEPGGWDTFARPTAFGCDVDSTKTIPIATLNGQMTVAEALAEVLRVGRRDYVLSAHAPIMARASFSLRGAWPCVAARIVGAMQLDVREVSGVLVFRSISGDTFGDRPGRREPVCKRALVVRPAALDAALGLARTLVGSSAGVFRIRSRSWVVIEASRSDLDHATDVLRELLGASAPPCSGLADCQKAHGQ